MQSLLSAAKQTWSSFTKWLWLRSGRKSLHHPNSPGHPLKVLCIVREKQGVAEALALVLEQEKCQVITVCDGCRGLELMRLEQPDVVILDELAPGLDGFKVYTAIKADMQLSQIPLVFVESGRIPHETWKRPTKDIIRLPAGPQEILAAIEYVLNQVPNPR